MLTLTSRIVGCCGRSLLGGQLPIGAGSGAEQMGLGADAFENTSATSATICRLSSLMFNIGGGFLCFFMVFGYARRVRPSPTPRGCSRIIKCPVRKCKMAGVSYGGTAGATPFCWGYHPSPVVFKLNTHRFGRFCVTAASRLAPERRPPPVRSHTEVGTRTTGAVSETSSTVARPAPSEKSC